MLLQLSNSNPSLCTKSDQLSPELSTIGCCFPLSHPLLSPCKCFPRFLCFTRFSCSKAQTVITLKLNYCAIVLVCLPAFSLFLYPIHPASPHWAIFLRLHFLILGAPWIRTAMASYCPLSRAQESSSIWLTHHSYSIFPHHSLWSNSLPLIFHKNIFLW